MAYFYYLNVDPAINEEFYYIETHTINGLFLQFKCRSCH